MFKILCTGNPDDIGIAMEIKKLFPESNFVSRTNGYDLSTNEGLEKLKLILKNYNVFINNAYVHSNLQLKLLSMVRDEWEVGHVFNIGTLIEYVKWLPTHTETDMAQSLHEDHVDAIRLRELGFALTNEHFKVTHVTVGGFKSSAKPRGLNHSMEPKHIANAIKWVIEAEFEVPIIGVEQSSDIIREYFNDRGKGLI
jgi:hypothetical protein